jgi:D-arabinose 1-dehydrogenase-like Zn-dependent alcohol dehydrogenase
MQTMRAARFDSATRELSVRGVPVPEPGPTDVLVRVKACGICLSDVHLMDGSLRSSLPVVTPGHEAAGVIERVGERVPGWMPGQRVVMAGGRQCGACANCGPGSSTEGAQVTVSAINRNCPGRSGPGQVWLASPPTVAASAIAGRLASFAELRAGAIP